MTVALAAGAGAAPLTFATAAEREYFNLALRCEGQLEEARRVGEGAEKACDARLAGEREKVRTATVICAPVCPACECSSGLICGASAIGAIVATGIIVGNACPGRP